MTLSHVTAKNSNPSISTTEIVNALQNQINNINQRSKQALFSELELELHQCFAEVERQCMKKLLENYDWDMPHFKDTHNQRYFRSSRNNKRYMTLAGEVTIERSLYRTERNGPTYCPLELNGGLIEGFWTPQAARQAMHLVSQLTPEEVETIFKEFGLMSPSKSSLDRLPKKLSEQWESKRLEMQQCLEEQYKIPAEAVLCGISLDGVLIPTRYTRVIGSDSRWAEASCGTVSFFDGVGQLLGTRYVARMPEHKKKSLKQQLSLHIASIQEQRPDIEFIKIADGARDNWTFLEGEVRQGECVLDFYHASEHLHKAIASLYSKNSHCLIKPFHKYRDILLNHPEGVNKIINHLKYQAKKHPKNKILKTEITYFSRHKKHCDYARLKNENKPIGSGIVESACKQVVQMRLKRSGQHWLDKGGQAILTFRSILLSKQFDTAWNEVKKLYHKPIEMPSNIVKFIGKN